MPETKHTVHVPVPQEVLIRVRAVLAGDEDLVSGDEDMGRTETICHTAAFPDGYQMDIKCCRGEPAWTEAVLFDANGNELCCTEPGEDYEGEWTVEYNGTEYTAIIEPES